MDAILIHGMGRKPMAMSILAARLLAAGIHPHFFGYMVAVEGWDHCVQRYERYINKRVSDKDYIIIGHSMGTVLTRAVLPKLIHKPKACFFLAPPTQVCKAARTFAHRPVARFFIGKMGRVLASETFMQSLPVPSVPTKVYAGVAGPRGRYSPFGDEPNDGLLTVKETLLPGAPTQTVPSLHTFIMNSKIVARDIVKIAKSKDLRI